MIGWTALPDDLAEEIGLIPAIVYSRVVRYCNMSTGKCYASLEAMGKGLGVTRMTVCNTLASLVELGYLQRIDAPHPRTPNTYIPTNKYQLWATVTGDSGCTKDIQPCIEDIQPCIDDIHNCIPDLPKIHINRDINKDFKREPNPQQFLDEKPANNDKNPTTPITPAPEICKLHDTLGYPPKYPLAGPDPVISPHSTGFGYPSRDSPLAVAQRKADALAKKAKAKTSSEIVAGWPLAFRENVTTYYYAYLCGIAPDGTNVRKPDASALIKQYEWVMDIDPAIFSPKDFEDAARYYWRAWKGMLSLKRLRSELSEWDARGRPKAKVAEQRGVTKNYAEIAAAEQAEWERLGCPKGWRPE
jgi:hypothetical protein